MGKTIRQIARQEAIIGVYQNLSVDATRQDIMNYVKSENTLHPGQSGYEFAKWLIDTTLENKESYIQLIEKYLKKGWTFERLSKMEQAILLVATCELLEEELDRRIVINEAVLNAKEYCDESSYRFINGVLNKIAG